MNMHTHLLAFQVARSCRRWAAVFPLATILASAGRPRLIDLESRALRCTPTLCKRKKKHMSLKLISSKEAHRRTGGAKRIDR